jgi:hypothetical protein
MRRARGRQRRAHPDVTLGILREANFSRVTPNTARSLRNSTRNDPAHFVSCSRSTVSSGKLPVHESLKDKLAIYGQRTYIGAWALEIVAAFLGLTTGIALGYQAFSVATPGSISSMDLMLASAPFFMVAIAELTKIPIATLLYVVSWLWKPVVFLFLVALAGITFETVFMGLERAVTLRQFRYEEIVRNIDKLKAESDEIESRLSDKTLNDRLTRAQESLNYNTKQAAQEHDSLSNQLSDVEKDLDRQQMLTPESAQLRDKISENRSDRDRLISERDIEIKNQEAEFESQRESFVHRIDEAVKNGDIVRKKQYEDQLDKLPNPRPRLEAQFATRIDPIQSEIDSLQAEFDQKQKNAPTMSPTERQRLESKREELKNRQDESDRSWEKRKEVASAQVEQVLNVQANQDTFLAEAQKRKDDLSSQMSDLEKQRIENARTDQVRRIAARVYGTKPESVTTEQAGFISVVWFGSLALLAALAGPLTAMVALALQSMASTEMKSTRAGKLSRLVRRLLLRWRWKRVRTIKVPVEVPVEKEVEKRVEVPVERVIKEILYVPVLTDDPDAIRRALNETLDKDIANLVTLSFAGPKHGRS